MRFHSTAFTSDGNWLCGWYSNTKNSKWMIWDTLRFENREEQRKPLLPPPPNGIEKPPILIPFNKHPMFAACDPFGRVALIRDKGPRRPESLEEMPGAVAAVPLEEDNVLLFIRQMHGEGFARINIASIGQQDGALKSTNTDWGKLGRACNPDNCGISAKEINSSVVLLTSFADGTLCKTKIGK